MRHQYGNRHRTPAISLRTASGAGRTELSAFDDALWGAGVANYNLIRLSSVIPAAATLTCDTVPLPGHHGDRLDCVYAAAHADQPGQAVWAGTGWVRDAAGRGLFVEHDAGTREELEELLRTSLENLGARRGGGYGKVQTLLVSARNGGLPACALAIAAYSGDGWQAP